MAQAVTRDKHIRVRQEQSALHALRANGINARVDAIDAPSKGQGTVVFLWAEAENALAGLGPAPGQHDPITLGGARSGHAMVAAPVAAR